MQGDTMAKNPSSSALQTWDYFFRLYHGTNTKPQGWETRLRGSAAQEFRAQALSQHAGPEPQLCCSPAGWPWANWWMSLVLQ